MTNAQAPAPELSDRAAAPRPVLHGGLSLSSELRVLGGFFMRRMAEFFSNRTNSIFGFLEITAVSVLFGIMGKFINDYSTPALKGLLQGCPDYISFLIVGHLVTLMVWSAHGNVSWLVRSREFPNLYMAPCRLPTIVLGANMWKYCWIVMELFLLMLISGWLFGVQFHLNAGFVLVVLGGIWMMTAFDMIGAGFKIITKSDSDPLNWTLGITGMVLSGQFFPIQALPTWLQPVCKLHPQYYINSLARVTVGGGADLSAVMADETLRMQLLGFLITSAVFLLLGWWIFKTGFRRARVEGTLGHQ
jgi:ABC-type multidrug transport system permease subunit